MITESEIDNLGIIYTPLSFVEEILNLIPDKVFKKNLKCLDVGSGTGNFAKILFKKIIDNINLTQDKGENDDLFIFRKSSLALKNITMLDINEKHINILRDKFGKEANIINCDFLDYKNELFINHIRFDLIVGNPPYNIKGKIKTPTNNNIFKKNDGITIYPKFIENALDLLKENGFLCFIVPIIWLKPDKFNLYHLLTNFKILKLNILNNFESNKFFNYNCQTPTCYFLLQKTKNDFCQEKQYKILNIFDKFEKKYIEYKLYKNFPIPIHGISIVNKFIEKVKIYGTLKIIKTNLPSKKILISNEKNENYPFKNIKSCKKKREKINDNINISSNSFHDNYELVINYSNNKLIYYNIPKLILAHKVYGIPYLDISGIYGISSRDNYILKDYKLYELDFLKYFFESKTIMFLFSTTRYRMQYLEKYCFEFIPDIIAYCKYQNINLEKIKKKIDNFLYKEIDLTDNEIEIINNNFNQ